jgi:hypothetical protein
MGGREMEKGVWAKGTGIDGLKWYAALSGVLNCSFKAKEL